MKMEEFSRDERDEKEQDVNIDDVSDDEELNDKSVLDSNKDFEEHPIKTSSMTESPVDSPNRIKPEAIIDTTSRKEGGYLDDLKHYHMYLQEQQRRCGDIGSSARLLAEEAADRDAVHQQLMHQRQQQQQQMMDLLYRNHYQQQLYAMGHPAGPTPLLHGHPTFAANPAAALTHEHFPHHAGLSSHAMRELALSEHYQDVNRSLERSRDRDGENKTPTRPKDDVTVKDSETISPPQHAPTSDPSSSPTSIRHIDNETTASPLNSKESRKRNASDDSSVTSPSSPKRLANSSTKTPWRPIDCSPPPPATHDVTASPHSAFHDNRQQQQQMQHLRQQQEEEQQEEIDPCGFPSPRKDDDARLRSPTGSDSPPSSPGNDALGEFRGVNLNSFYSPEKCVHFSFTDKITSSVLH